MNENQQDRSGLLRGLMIAIPLGAFFWAALVTIYVLRG